MAGDIEHKDLPDELCHEPKGASTASVGEVYVADGEGSGEFKKVPVSSLDIIVSTVEDMIQPVVPSTVSITDGGLSQTAIGVLTDVQAFAGIPQAITTKINLTSSELLRFYQNQAAINQALSTGVSNIVTKLNQIITALKNEGLLDE